MTRRETLIALPLLAAVGCMTVDSSPCELAAEHIEACTGDAVEAPTTCSDEQAAAAEGVLESECEAFAGGKSDLLCSAALRWAGLCKEDEIIATGENNAPFIDELRAAFPEQIVTGRYFKSPDAARECDIEIEHRELSDGSSGFSIKFMYADFELTTRDGSHLLRYEPGAPVSRFAVRDRLDMLAELTVTELEDGFTRFDVDQDYPAGGGGGPPPGSFSCEAALLPPTEGSLP